jgi:hypothetical protein
MQQGSDLIVTTKSMRTLKVLASLLVPFFLQWLIVVGLMEIQLKNEPYVDGSLFERVLTGAWRVSFVVSTLLGFLFVANVFWRFAVYLAIVYIPAMCWLLVMFSLNVVARLYGRYL